MPHVADNPGAYAGRSVQSGHCVPFVREASGAPHTSLWRRGVKVRGGNVPPGTAIATFHPTGLHYENDTTGKSHAAILIAENSDGLLVWDCWVGQPVKQRVIRFRGGLGDAVNDGDQFWTVETEST